MATFKHVHAEHDRIAPIFVGDYIVVDCDIVTIQKGENEEIVAVVRLAPGESIMKIGD